MIRFEDDFNIVKFWRNNVFSLGKLHVSAIVFDKDKLENCILDSEGFAYTYNDRCSNGRFNICTYDSIEEAQMNAAMQGIASFEDHIPVLSVSSIMNFKTSKHLFPIDKFHALKLMQKRIEELDMFKLH